MWGSWNSSQARQNDMYGNDNGDLYIYVELELFPIEKTNSGPGEQTCPQNETLLIQNYAELSKQLGEAFVNQELCDVKIRCEDKTFECHEVQ